MKSFAKKESDSPATQANSRQWALVRVTKAGPWHAMELPVTIGCQPDCDIYVNAPTIRNTKVIAISETGVVVVEPQTKMKSSAKDLSVFGIAIQGPFNEDPSKMSPMNRVVATLLANEASAFHNRYPQMIQRVLPKKQTPRLVAAFAGLILAFAFVSSGSSTSPVVQDLSQTPVKAAFGSINDINMTSPGINGSYAKGMRIMFGGTTASQSLPYVLTIGVSGIDLANEISISFNDKPAGAISANISCSESICYRDFPINQTLVSTEANIVELKHSDPSSPYFVKSVFLRAMEPATAEDRERATQLLASAERHYEERHLLVQNIRNAVEALNEVDRIIGTRTGLDELKARLAIDRKNATDAFKEISGDLQFKLQKELKLDHVKPSIALINDLLKLYPDPASRQYMMLVQQRKVLQEKSKQ